jgi:hypothetical protein
VNDPVSAREALLIEAIGDVANLIESVDRLTSVIQEKGRAFDRANAGLHDSLTRFEAEIISLSENAKVQTVKHILARTDEATRKGIDTQAQAMTKAATQLFDSRVDPRLQQLARVIAHQVDRLGRPWERWLTNAATALASSVATLAVVAHLWPR